MELLLELCPAGLATLLVLRLHIYWALGLTKTARGEVGEAAGLCNMNLIAN